MIQRIIKFRAWDEQAEVMHNDFRHIKSGEEGNDWIIFTSDRQPLCGEPHPFQNPHFQQQFKVMQFTGLYDKNGVEIYEGDVCKITEPDEDSCAGREFEYIGYIVWGIGKWRFKDNKNRALGESDWTRYTSVGDWRAEYEVIGNIYENPELLEE